MNRWTRRLVALGRLPARTWNHFRALFGRRRVVSNWLELLARSTPVYLVATRPGRRKQPGAGIVIRFRSGLTLEIDASMRENVVALSETYDVYMGHFGQILTSGDVVIDVGAHVGTFAVPALFANPGIRVLAYEPDPQNFAMLERNAARNQLDTSRFCAHRLAVAGRAGTLLFSRGRTSTTGSIARSGFYKASADAETVTVTATTLEEIFRDHNITHCRLLKIDCEGSEYEIFSALPDEVFSRIQHMIVEAHPTRVGAPAELKSALQERGFSVAEQPLANGCSEFFCSRHVPPDRA